MKLDVFIVNSQEYLVSKLHKSIYGLKQTSYPSNMCFDKEIETLDFDQNKDVSFFFFFDVQESVKNYGSALRSYR